MVVFLNSSYVPDGMASDVHLLDPSCIGEVYDNTTIRLRTNFSSCGTTVDVSSLYCVFFVSNLSTRMEATPLTR